MMTPTLVSIIICTCNRADSLQTTLERLSDLPVPNAYNVELLVVNNNCSDSTDQVVGDAKFSNMTLRLLHEPERGQVRARNLGLRESKGDIIVFTDDDVIPPPEWLGDICDPIRLGKADAVAGGVVSAPELQRPWVDDLQRAWLAETVGINPQAPERMVGANMAFSRRVLEKVPQFDVALGPGARGFGDDTLFAEQLIEAGYKIVSAFERPVVHYFRPDRLSRQGFLEAARSRGKTSAYVEYHWEHKDVSMPEVRKLKKQLEIALIRLMEAPKWRTTDGMSSREMYCHLFVYLYEAWPAEAKLPRKYDKRGLTPKSV